MYNYTITIIMKFIVHAIIIIIIITITTPSSL